MWISLLRMAGTLALSWSATTPPEKPTPSFERIDPRFDTLVPLSALVEKVCDGFTKVEGLTWNRKGGFLVFSDVPQNTVFKWKEGSGTSTLVKPSGYTGSVPFAGPEPGASGLTYDGAGRLILCEHGDRRITSLHRDGPKVTLVDRYDGKRLNSPNDAVFHPNGDLYFTDPPFGLPKTFEDPAKELGFSGVFRLSRDGKLTLLTKELAAPNGLAFSPDGKTLYVSDADPKKPTLMAYPVKEDGTLAEGRVFAEGIAWIKDRPGGADGIKTDVDGNVFTAGPGGIYVFAADGKHLGTILLGVATSNCAWGDDGSALYITAGTTVYRVRLSTKGFAQ